MENVGPLKHFGLENTNFLRCEKQLVINFNCSVCTFSKYFNNFEIGKLKTYKVVIQRFCLVRPLISVKNLIPGRRSVNMTVVRAPDFRCFKDNPSLDFEINIISNSSKVTPSHSTPNNVKK